MSEVDSPVGLLNRIDQPVGKLFLAIERARAAKPQAVAFVRNPIKCIERNVGDQWVLKKLGDFDWHPKSISELVINLGASREDVEKSS
jgi:hypothetical protein